MIAKKIIEIGQTGLKDPGEICGRAVEDFGCRKDDQRKDFLQKMLTARPFDQ